MEEGSMELLLIVVVVLLLLGFFGRPIPYATPNILLVVLVVIVILYLLPPLSGYRLYRW
jgi:membrane protein YdbS with pleckstrin-like domain